MYQQVVTDSFSTAIPGFMYYGGEDFGYIEQRMGAYSDLLDDMSLAVWIRAREWSYEHVEEFHKTLELIKPYRYKTNRSYRKK